MSNPAPSQPSSTLPTTQAAASRPPESDSAVEFLTALAPTDTAVRRRAFAALLRAVTREVQAQ